MIKVAGIILIILLVLFTVGSIISLRRIKKSAADVISKANDLMANMDDVDTDLVEIRQQIKELSGILDDVEDEIEDVLDNVYDDEDEDDEEYVD